MFILERVSELRSERGMSFQIWGPSTRREKEYLWDVWKCKLSFRLGRVVQSWVKITQSSCEIWIQIWKLKKHFSLIFFVYKLMIGSSKNNRENYPRKCFWTPEKETRVKFNPGLSANRPSNNWAQVRYWWQSELRTKRDERGEGKSFRMWRKTKQETWYL